MNKTLLISAMGFGIALSASAADISELMVKENHRNVKAELREATFRGKTYQVYEGSAKPLQAPAKEAQLTDVITNPKGKSRLYEKEAAGVAAFIIVGIQSYIDADLPAATIWGDNNEVYFLNFLTYDETQTYIKGVLNGDMITIPMNQTVEYDELTGNGVNIGVLKTTLVDADRNPVENPDDYDVVYIDFQYVDSFDSVTLSVANDGTLSLNIPGEPFDGEYMTEYSVGYYDAATYEWVAYTDFMQVYHPIEGEIVSIPDSAEITNYAFINKNTLSGYPIEVAFVDDEVYIKGLNDHYSYMCFKGYVKDNVITIPNYQYLGIEAFDWTFLQVFYLDWDSPWFFVPAAKEVTYELLINEDGSIVSSPESSEYYLIYNLNFDPENYPFMGIGTYSNINITLNNTFGGTPINPYDLTYYNIYNSYGANAILFNLPLLTTDYNLMNSDDLYYRIYIDGEPFVFEEHEGVNGLGEEITMYQGLKQPTDMIPYYFKNNEDIAVFSNTWEVDIYSTDFTTIGVQLINTYNGEISKSDIVSYDIATGETTIIPDGGTTAVKGNLTDQIEKVEYFTIDGRMTNHPESGIFLKKITYSDGNIEVKKVMIK